MTKRRKFVYEFDIRAILDRNFIEYRDNGKWLLMPCPFPEHDDSNPSFNIDSEGGGYNCYSCGRTGSTLSLVLQMGWAKLSEVSVGNIADIVTNRDWKKGLAMLEDSGDVVQTFRLPLGFKKLDRSREALPYLRYLRDRGLLINGIIREFGIGYSTRFDPTYHRSYLNRIIIPVHDTEGNLLWAEGRAIKKVSKVKYYRPKGSPRNYCLFNFHRIENFEYTVVVEGILDAVYLWLNGINAICIFGTAVSGYQLELLLEFDKLYLCFDNDSAGIAGHQKLSKALSGTGIDLYHIKLPRKQDALSIGIDLFNKKMSEARKM